MVLMMMGWAPTRQGYQAFQLGHLGFLKQTYTVVDIDLGHHALKRVTLVISKKGPKRGRKLKL